MKYKVIKTQSIDDLNKAVNRHLKEGWVLNGVFSVGEFYYYQPMVYNEYVKEPLQVG